MVTNANFPFFNKAISAWNKSSMPTQLLALGSGYLNAAWPLALWAAGTHSEVALWGGGAATFIIRSVAVYLIVCDLKRDVTRRVMGWLWLTGSTIALYTPFAVAFAPAYALDGHPFTGAFLLLAIAALPIIALLPAWPAVQMRAERLTSPLRVFRATKGYRWGLALSFFFPGSLAKAIPPTDAASTLSGALVRFAGHGLLDTFLTLVAGGIAVTAWQFACERDPSLCVVS